VRSTRCSRPPAAGPPPPGAAALPRSPPMPAQRTGPRAPRAGMREDLSIGDRTIAPSDSFAAAMAFSHEAGIADPDGGRDRRGSFTGSPFTRGPRPRPGIRKSGALAITPSARYSEYPIQWLEMFPALPTGTQCSRGAGRACRQTRTPGSSDPATGTGSPIHERDRVVLGQVARELEGRVEVPLDSSTRAPCTSVPAILPRRDLPFGTRTTQLSQPSRRTRRRGAGVPRGAQTPPSSLLEGLADRERHPTVLDEPSVRTLVLQPDGAAGLERERVRSGRAACRLHTGSRRRWSGAGKPGHGTPR